MNIVLTNVSTVKMDKDGHLNTSDYLDEYNNEIKGTMTNEAPIKSIIIRLEKKNQRLDHIIYIESEKVRTESIVLAGNKMSHAEYLRKTITDFARKEGYFAPIYDAKKDSIYIKDEPNAAHVSDTVFSVYDRIMEIYKEDEDINIYVESNGGVRYVLTMLLSVTKTLENRFENIHIREVLSMVHSEKTTFVRNTKEIYDTSQIMGIVDEYVNYGRVASLKRYVNILFCGYESKEILAEMNAIVDDLSKLSDDMQLCRTQNILNDFYYDGGIGEKIHSFLEKYDKPEKNNSALSIFTYILREIAKEYEGTIYEKDNKSDNVTMYLPRIIKWCLEKNFIQQALTLCSERIPEYLFATHKIMLSDLGESVREKINNKKYEWNYFFICNYKNVIYPQVLKLYEELVFQQVQDKVNRTIKGYNWISIKHDDVEISQDMKNNNRIKTLVKNISLFVVTYFNTTDQTVKKAQVVKWMQASDLDLNLLNIEFAVSNNKSYQTDIVHLLNGRSRKDGKWSKHDNLNTKKDRMEILLPIIIRNTLEERRELTEAVSAYEKLLDELYHEEREVFVSSLKKRYAKDQSKKFFMKDAFEIGFVNNSISYEKLQTILCLYSLCKEQRNISNHAYVSEEDGNVAMNSEQLRIVIQRLVEECE